MSEFQWFFNPVRKVMGKFEWACGQEAGLNRWEHRAFGLWVAVRTCKWGCLVGNGCFWIGNSWHLPPPHHTLLRGRCPWGWLSSVGPVFQSGGYSCLGAHTLPTKNMLSKISSLVLRYSAISVLLLCFMGYSWPEQESHSCSHALHHSPVR